MGIIGLFLRLKSAIAHARAEIFRWADIITPNPCCPAEFPELLGIGPGKLTACRIDLIKSRETAESEVMHKPLEIMG